MVPSATIVSSTFVQHASLHSKGVKWSQGDGSPASILAASITACSACSVMFMCHPPSGSTVWSGHLPSKSALTSQKIWPDRVDAVPPVLKWPGSTLSGSADPVGQYTFWPKPSSSFSPHWRSCSLVEPIGQ